VLIKVGIDEKRAHTLLGFERDCSHS